MDKSQSTMAVNCHKRRFKNPNEPYLAQKNQQLINIPTKRSREMINYNAVALPGKNNGRQSIGKSQSFFRNIPDSHRMLHVRDLGIEVGHHDVFEHFCRFGSLKRVTVRQRTEHYKYASILYTSDESAKLAIAANPHNLRGRQYYCYKAGAVPKTDIQRNRSTPIQINSYQNRLGISLRQYVYCSTTSPEPSTLKAKQIVRSLTRLPQASVALLHYLFKGETTVIKTYQNLSYRKLVSNVYRNFNFVRHSYTNFAAHQKQNRQYEQVPIEAKVTLTAIAYADLRDRPDLLSFHYTVD